MGARFFHVFLLLLGYAIAPGAFADDAILERAYFRDDTAQRSFAEVQDLPFTPYQGLLSQGYRRHVAYWLKLRIRAADEKDLPYVLRVRQSWHDDIRLFDPADPRREPRLAGDRYPWGAAEVPSFNHGFLLKKTAYERDVYLRVESVHTYMVDVQALEEFEAEHAEWKTQAINFAYLGILGIIFFWAALNYVATSEKIVGAFAIYQFSNFFYCAFLSGLARVILDGVLPSEWLDKLTSVIIIASTLAGLLFHRVLLAEYAISRSYLLAMAMFLCFPVAALFVFAIGESTWALLLNMIGILGFASVMVATVWFGIPGGQSDSWIRLPVRWLRIFYSVIFALAVFGASPLIGWLQATEFTLGLFLFHSAISTVVMGALLHNRAGKIAGLQAAQLSTAKQRMEQEAQARYEQNQFMSMLNHELKTPLSVLKLLVADHPKRDLAETTIDSMTALLERCLLSDRLEHDLPVKISEFSPSAILEESLQKTRQPSRFKVGDNEAHTLHGDPDLYAVIVGNLLDNALKYAPPASTIEVSLRSSWTDGRALSRLAVCNRIGRSGTPDLDRVFDKYYRAESAKSVPGTGLGLYLVKSFAEMMGGGIDCAIDTSTPQTICFELCLPR